MKTLNRSFNSSNKQNSQSIVKRLTLKNGSVVDDETEIAECFNNYFCNVGKNLASKLPDSGNKYTSFLPKALPNSFVCNDISLSELNSVISSINNKKTCGPDQLSAYMIKLSKDFIIQPLLYIFNLSFSQGVFPSELKSSNIIPLFKKGKMDLLCNYRPITPSSVFS